MKALLYFVLLYVLYRFVRSLLRSPGPGRRGETTRPPQSPGEEMVQDPQCRTYIVKSRAFSRRIGGQTQYFCSSACAEAHERGSGPA